MDELQCEMILLHHPDCECDTCTAHTDEVCKGVAVGTVRGPNGVRVCQPCTEAMEKEEFEVTLWAQ